LTEQSSERATRGIDNAHPTELRLPSKWRLPSLLLLFRIPTDRCDWSRRQSSLWVAVAADGSDLVVAVVAEQKCCGPNEAGGECSDCDVDDDDHRYYYHPDFHSIRL